MSKEKKALQRGAQKFRRTRPAFHSLLSYAIDEMAYTIKKLGTPEVTVVVKHGKIVDSYASDKPKTSKA